MAWWFFQNAVVTAILALGVLVMCRFVRIGPVARHALWVLVLVKFVTPPIVEWPWAAPDPLGLVPVETASFTESDAAPTPRVVSVESRTAVDSDVTSHRAEPERGFQESAQLVVWAWALGAVGLLVLEGLRVAMLARRVRHGRTADPAIVRRVAELSASLDLKPIPVVLVPGHASPMVWCFGRTRLLWPEDFDADAPEALDADAIHACIDGLIVHELAHVKRRDHLVGWIELAAGVVWWWNPLFWFVRAALREQAELACDAWVISTLPNGRRAYAESLLALSGAALRGTRSPGMAVLGIRASSRRVLERRLVMIMKGRVPLRLPLAGVFTIALVAAATLPAWATGQQTAPPPPPPAAPVASAMPTLPAPASQAAPLPSTIQAVPVPPAPAVQSASAPALPPRPRSAPARTRAQVPTPPQPSTAPAPPSRAKQATAPAGAPPKVMMPVQRREMVYAANKVKLPAEGQQLVETFDADVTAIYKEIEPKVEARRQAAIKSLEALQEQYTKAGKLDEAVAIRDYLRAGGPAGSSLVRYSLVKKGDR
jgi:beta-lactamase regulating signal transducer with metallopeptidase domain